MPSKPPLFQPQGPLLIDWGHPLAKGLTLCVIGEKQELVSQSLYGFAPTVCRGGYSIADGGLDSSTYSALVDTQDMTIVTGVDFPVNNLGWAGPSYGFYVATADNMQRGFMNLDTYNYIAVCNRHNTDASTGVITLGNPYYGILGYSGVGGQTCSWYENGRLGGTVAWSGDAWTADTRNYITFSACGMRAFFRYQWNRVLTDDEHAQIAANPWCFLKGYSSPIILNLSAVTHTSTGALTGQGSTVAGTANRFRAHATTGVLTGQGSTISGTAQHIAIHATSGVLTGQSSTLDGTASRTRQHATDGALTGQGSTIAGTAQHIAIHATSGALAGQGAVVSGAVSRTRVHGTSGILSGQGAVVSGTSQHIAIHATSGVLAGQGSTVSGTSVHNIPHATSGALAGQGAVIAGVSERIQPGSTGLMVAPRKSKLMPPWSTLINTGNPITRGLKIAALPDHKTFVNIVNGERAAQSGTAPNPKPFFGNQGFVFNNSGYYTFSNTNLPANTGDISVLVYINWDGNTSTLQAICGVGGTGAGGIEMYRRNSVPGVNVFSTGVQALGYDLIAGTPLQVGYKRNGSASYTGYYNGVEKTTATSSGASFSANPPFLIGKGDTDLTNGSSIYYVFVWDRLLTESEFKSMYDDPFQVFIRPSSLLLAHTTSTTHVTTGALTGQGSTVAGTAQHIAKHATTGALAGQGSEVAGTSARTRQHATSGVLAGQGSTISGTAQHIAIHTTTGALTGQGSEISGTAARALAHDTIGALAGQGASVSGTAQHIAIHSTSGALIGSGAVINGAAQHIAIHTTSGALAGQGTVITGSARRLVTHETSGALVGSGASISGVSVHNVDHETSGALTGQGSTVSGTANRFRAHATSGALVGQTPTIAGSANRYVTHVTSGSLVGQSGAISGTSEHISVHQVTGALVGQGSIIDGTSHHKKIHAVTGALVGQGAVVTGLVSHIAFGFTLTQNDIDAIASAVWAKALESSTASEMMRVIFAAVSGERQGLGTATERYMSEDGTKPRVTFTPVDGYGNGTTVRDGTP